MIIYLDSTSFIVECKYPVSLYHVVITDSGQGSLILHLDVSTPSEYPGVPEIHELWLNIRTRDLSILVASFVMHEDFDPFIYEGDHLLISLCDYQGSPEFYIEKA